MDPCDVEGPEAPEGHFHVSDAVVMRCDDADVDQFDAWSPLVDVDDSEVMGRESFEVRSAVRWGGAGRGNMCNSRLL